MIFKIILFLFFRNYLISTVAPASVNLALISSASALETPFLISHPLSAKSLPSFSPRPVTSLITLITAILFHPAEVKTASKAVFSSASAEAPPAAATITGAAAETPNSSSIALTKSFNSTIVNSLTKSIIFVAFALNSAIIIILYNKIL
jgi:hypothetical protein